MVQSLAFPHPVNFCGDWTVFLPIDVIYNRLVNVFQASREWHSWLVERSYVAEGAGSSPVARQFQFYFLTNNIFDTMYSVHCTVPSQNLGTACTMTSYYGVFSSQ